MCLDRSGGCKIKQPINPIQQECLFIAQFGAVLLFTVTHILDLKCP